MCVYFYIFWHGVREVRNVPFYPLCKPYPWAWLHISSQRLSKEMHNVSCARYHVVVFLIVQYMHCIILRTGFGISEAGVV